LELKHKNVIRSKCMSSKKVDGLVDDIHINDGNSLLIYAFFSPLFSDVLH